MDEGAERNLGQHGSRGGRTHPPAAAARSRCPAASKIRGQLSPLQPDPPDHPSRSWTRSSRPGSSRAAGRPSTTTPPTRFLALRRRRRFLRALQGRRLVLSHRSGLRTDGAATSRVEAGAVERQRKKKGNGEHCAEYINLDALYRPVSEWLTRGPK